MIEASERLSETADVKPFEPELQLRVDEEQKAPYKVKWDVDTPSVGIGVTMTSIQGQRLWAFIQGSRVEIRKVVWPTRAETLQTTLAVLLMVLLVGIFLWLLDMFLLWAIQILTGQGS